LLDVDLLGTANRLCPDDPVPVVDVEQELVRPGGAGLAARLAAADGVRVTLVTALADDDDGRRLLAGLAGVPTIRSVSDTPTPVKARVRSNGRSVTRLDRGSAPPAVDVTDDMVDAIRSADAVLVADYGRGMAAHRRIRDVLREVAQRTPVVWDPHPRGPAPVRGAWLVTPNLAEARAIVDEPDAVELAGRLRERWGCRAVAVTLGSRGAVLDHGGVPVAVPASAVQVGDPCGAGDRFAVAAACALMHGSSVDEAVHGAVAMAAAFLAGGGVASVGRDGAAAAPEGHGLTDALAVIARTRATGGTIVATGGCFDLLHTGHLRTLRAAASLGDCLVVCLNSDSSVRRLKGADRPINHEADRAELLASLRCVDAVVLFGEDTPEAVLSRLRPDLWVKGGDYSVDALSEADLVREWGGRAVVVPYHAGRSTTRLATALADID
jgi:rfaE bifunctional protein nucleotidyltransferase chain/domain/rfaE bifunctional protein kinase chain/domain